MVAVPVNDADPNILPGVEGFVDVHPRIVAHHDSHPVTESECFHLCMTKDVYLVVLPCAWTNTCVALYLR